MFIGSASITSRDSTAEQKMKMSAALKIAVSLPTSAPVRLSISPTWLT